MGNRAGGETEQVCFEFNDMREDYVDGISLLVKSHAPNPTYALELSEYIASQGNVIRIKIILF